MDAAGVAEGAIFILLFFSRGSSQSAWGLEGGIAGPGFVQGNSLRGWWEAWKSPRSFGGSFYEKAAGSCPKVRKQKERMELGRRAGSERLQTFFDWPIQVPVLRAIPGNQGSSSPARRQPPPGEVTLLAALSCTTVALLGAPRRVQWRRIPERTRGRCTLRRSGDLPFFAGRPLFFSDRLILSYR